MVVIMPEGRHIGMISCKSPELNDRITSLLCRFQLQNNPTAFLGKILLVNITTQRSPSGQANHECLQIIHPMQTLLKDASSEMLQSPSPCKIACYSS